MGKININVEKKLNNFPLSVAIKSDARFIGILGESGAGKSQTLRCIAGIEKPDNGRICINDSVYFDAEKKINITVQKRNVGYMFQNYALFPTMSVYENVVAGIRGKDISSEDIWDYLRRFQIDELADVYPNKLSGGQKQRVALARILIGKPEIIMLDEPFSALDATLRDKMQQELMASLKEYNGTVIMVSHNRDEIYRFSDEIYILSNGKIIESGDKKEIFMNPHKKETARLTGCKNITQIKRIDDHNAYVPEWNINIRTERVIPECEYIAYRAHDFGLLYSDDTEELINVIPAKLENMAEMPFETNLYFAGKISCFISRDEYKGIPKNLKLKEDKIIFLKD